MIHSWSNFGFVLVTWDFRSCHRGGSLVDWLQEFGSYWKYNPGPTRCYASVLSEYVVPFLNLWDYGKLQPQFVFVIRNSFLTVAQLIWCYSLMYSMHTWIEIYSAAALLNQESWFYCLRPHYNFYCALNLLHQIASLWFHKTVQVMILLEESVYQCSNPTPSSQF